MDIQAEKLELIKVIMDTEDEALIYEIKSIVESHEHVLHEDLPEYVKEGLKRAEEDIAAGRLTPHDEVMKKYEKYYKHL